MSENKIKLPEVIVFAGPNGSGKSTITKMAKTVGKYINADDIKSATHCTDLEAAQKAERLRNLAIGDHEDFTAMCAVGWRKKVFFITRDEKL